MIIDGKAIAARIVSRVKERAAALPERPSFLAIGVAPSAATRSYLLMKQRQAERGGIRMEVRLYDQETTEGLIRALAQAEEDAVIVQLPLPENIDTQRVLDAIPSHKDADVLSPRTRREGSLLHPVAAAIKSVLAEGSLDPKGKKATVIGQGWLVGAPAADWLRSVGASVTTVTKDFGILGEACHDADIIVTGAGVAGLITPDQVRPGAAVIDIGTSELGGSIAGDADPEVARVAGLFTPVPGGVGPLTVAHLLENVVTVAERQRDLRTVSR
ncbi:MAG: methylenetetrahydrofolate dehydrogenase / methenyltetrahydrofolate cyclohydrolase [Candidatus Parcubacteria bacterium]|jgi:methylenetetrahydrofolate dehydrogenase (NADP+)/methenyltetrahydrofolate cyclohydrolase|nr:methylenetetrahydrofolate dehydrogenase / methenyltetrahydrofolate cyclohydrolase [Candidatus Parcubacteria bacterium]